MNKNQKLTNNQQYNLPSAKQQYFMTRAALRNMRRNVKDQLHSENLEIAVRSLQDRINPVTKTLFDRLNNEKTKSEIGKLHSSVMIDNFNNNIHAELKKMLEKNRINQEKMFEALDELDQHFVYFHQAGWLIPDNLDPQDVRNMHSREQADEFMKTKIDNNPGLILMSLQSCLEQDNLPESINLLLNNIIQFLEKDISTYKVMLPAIFSVIDCLVTKWLGEYEPTLTYLSRYTVKKLKTKLQKISDEENRHFNSLYQAEALMNLLKDKYYPDNPAKHKTDLIRNAVAHGTFNYQTYTIYDFAKVAIIVEHISGLREMFKEYSTEKP